jgi:hypothetical protein
MKLKPIKQGVDGFCAVYSVMNSIMWLNKIQLDEDTVENDLFPHLMKSCLHILPHMIWEGSDTSDMPYILSSAEVWCSTHNLIFSWKKPVLTNNNWLTSIKNHTDMGKPVVFGMSEPYGHWSVITQINKKLTIFDSYNIQYITNYSINNNTDYVLNIDDFFLIG